MKTAPPTAPATPMAPAAPDATRRISRRVGELAAACAKPRTATPGSAFSCIAIWSSLHLTRRRCFQQVIKRLLPKLGKAGRTMATRIGPGRYQIVAAVLHALDLAIHETGFRRIAFVVRRIDGEQRGLDLVQLRCWIIVARGLILIDHV